MFLSEIENKLNTFDWITLFAKKLSRTISKAHFIICFQFLVMSCSLSQRHLISEYFLSDLLRRKRNAIKLTNAFLKASYDR